MGFWVNFATVALIVTMNGTAAAADYTTISTEMKITIELETEAPAAWYDFNEKTLAWRDVADNDSHYLRVTVRDGAGGTVAGATVNAAVLSLKDKIIGTSITLHETWDQGKTHYGANLQLAEDITSGNVAVKLSPGKGRRIGRETGDFFTKAVTVKFTGVKFDLGSPGEPAKLDKSDGKTSKPVRVEWPKGRRPYVSPTPYPGAEQVEPKI